LASIFTNGVQMPQHPQAAKNTTGIETPVVALVIARALVVTMVDNLSAIRRSTATMVAGRTWVRAR
jgi:hypothetical protein